MCVCGVVFSWIFYFKYIISASHTHTYTYIYTQKHKNTHTHTHAHTHTNRKKLISKTVKNILGSSSKMPFVLKIINFFYFWKTINFVKNLEITQIAERRKAFSLRHIDVISKTITIFGFNNNTHLCNMSCLEVSSRSVFRTLWNISVESFCESM